MLDHRSIVVGRGHQTDRVVAEQELPHRDLLDVLGRYLELGVEVHI